MSNRVRKMRNAATLPATLPRLANHLANGLAGDTRMATYTTGRTPLPFDASACDTEEMGLLGWLDRLDERALHPDETIEHSVLANREQNGRRAVGGRLCITNRRLVFTPNRVDAALAGLPWSCALSDVRAVGIAPRGRHPFSGARVRRLRLTMVDSSVELFVVRQLAPAVALVEEAVARGRR